MLYKKDRDPFDECQYRIFRWLLFILFIYYALQFLDSHIHLRRFISGLVG